MGTERNRFLYAGRNVCGNERGDDTQNRAAFEKQNGKTNTHKTENRYNVSRITEYIQEHYADQDLSIGTLAELVYLTPTYLSTVF